MKGEGHRDWENVIGRRSVGVNEYIQCQTIFTRNVAMIELIYTVRSYTVWVKIEIVSKSALLGSSLRHVGSDNDAISYVSAGEPCPCLCLRDSCAHRLLHCIGTQNITCTLTGSLP